MKHLKDEQLILYYYGEGVERAGTEAHLAACESCQASYDRLRETLAAIDAAPLPARPEDYGARVWQRLRPRLGEKPRFDWLGLFQPRRWVFGASLAALLAGAFLLGRFWPRPPEPSRASVPVSYRDRVLVLAMSEHLEQSQMLLIELVNAPAGGSIDLTAQQQGAEDLVEANRLYRQAATGAGEAALAGLLDELERWLLEIAHSPSRLSSRELEEFRRRIDQQEMIFKIHVIGRQLRAREEQVEPALPPARA